ncbi:MAG: HNH endonuclease signature motif containing protein [Alphaproteobacteria bacterium]
MTVPVDGCLIWIGSMLQNGYGQVRFSGKTMSAHRASFIAHHGVIPEGHVVRHRCDNRLCVHPDHLTSGTAQDNTDDKMSRGRHRSGQGRRFTPEEREYIRSSPKSQRELARELGCTQPAISKVRR